MPTLTYSRADALTDTALVSLIDSLSGFGNTIGHDHRAALRRILDAFTAMASGTQQGRYAYDLPTGAGKTQSIVAWCVAVHRLGLPYSVMVAASKVEALCTLKRDLIAAGVPDDMIGLEHSYGFAGGTRGEDIASLPATGQNDQRQFVLVTHSKVRRKGSNILTLNQYRGAPRDLVIWDESLLVSDSTAIARLDIESALGGFRPRARASSEAIQHAALGFLEDCWGALEAELAAQRADGRGPGPIRLPERSELELSAYRRILSRDITTDPLRRLVDICQEPLRVVATNQGSGAFVAYDIAVPRELTNIVVLDASFPIRLLEQLDRTIQRDPEFDGAVKAYGKVTIHQLRHGSGRTTMEKSFSQLRRDDRKVSLEVAEVVKAVPCTEGVIIFTFKPKADRRANMPKVLRQDLEALGVDTAAQLPDGKPHIVFLTWGMETSLSEYAYCQHVVFAGVLHRSDADIAGSIVGQTDDLLADVSTARIRDVQRSEVAHSLYQAMSRGAARQTSNGEAHAMHAWLIHRDPAIRELLSSVMPGVRWERWQPQHLQESSGKIEDVAITILEHLRTVPRDIEKLSSKALKAALNLAGISPSTFTRALETALSSPSAEWALQGRSVVRGEAMA